MNEAILPEDDSENTPSVSPLKLNRNDNVTRMRRRISPDVVPDDGVSPLDVAAFTSSI